MYACNGGNLCTKGRRSRRRSRMCTLQQMQDKELLQAFCRLAIEHGRGSCLCMSAIANQVAVIPLQSRRITQHLLGDNHSLVPTVDILHIFSILSHSRGNWGLPFEWYPMGTLIQSASHIRQPSIPASVCIWLVSFSGTSPHLLTMELSFL